MPMISGDFVRRRRNSLDDELPPPPVSPPRASRTEGPEAPGYENDFEFQKFSTRLGFASQIGTITIILFCL